MKVTITYSKTIFDAKTHNKDKEHCRMFLYFWLSKVILEYEMLSLELLFNLPRKSCKIMKKINRKMNNVKLKITVVRYGCKKANVQEIRIIYTLEKFIDHTEM